MKRYLVHRLKVLNHLVVINNSCLQKGKQELYKLGQVLRERYKNFLSEEYRVKDVSVQSSYANRCQMSASTLLAGLYPPKGEQIWNPDLLWQPIPVNPIPRELDNVCKYILCITLLKHYCLYIQLF